MSRKKARIGQMQLLYQMDLNKDYDINMVEQFLDNNVFAGDEIDYINRASQEILIHMDQIDALIESNLEGWGFHRLAKVDRSILRIAVYEFLYRDDIPEEVSINEAVDIAKAYSSEEAPKFINGILGSIYRNLDKQ
ncbi:MAG: transcription antitermination factor NusB [Tissierellia bacterium]|nr:transcription antitermination factor NusB [Tissierellia bacterium]